MPAHPFDELLAANARYARSFQLGHLEARAARGLAVVTCIDSRIEPLQLLGLEPGDAKILRTAGAEVTADVLRSLAMAVDQLGVDHVLVMPHTDCAAGAGASQVRTLEASVARILDAPELAGRAIRVAGMRYDVRTGLLEPLVPVRSAADHLDA